jgi:hypothetical protein
MIQNHLTTKEQSLALYERGLRRESEYYWKGNKLTKNKYTYSYSTSISEGDYEVTTSNILKSNIPTYLLSELMGIKPRQYSLNRIETGDWCLFKEDGHYSFTMVGRFCVASDVNEVNAISTLLCLLHDENIIDLSKL